MIGISQDQSAQQQNQQQKTRQWIADQKEKLITTT
jgi:hypothetical protein